MLFEKINETRKTNSPILTLDEMAVRFWNVYVDTVHEHQHKNELSDNDVEPFARDLVNGISSTMFYSK